MGNRESFIANLFECLGSIESKDQEIESRCVCGTGAVRYNSIHIYSELHPSEHCGVLASQWICLGSLQKPCRYVMFGWVKDRKKGKAKLPTSHV